MKTYKYLLAVLLIIVPAISFASIDTNLSFGSRGQAVTDLQNLLISKGFLNTQASGGFYLLTKQAVIAYQTSLRLPATGFVGPMTRQKINSWFSSQTASSFASAQPVSNPTTASTVSPISSTVAPAQSSASQTQNSAPISAPTSVSGSESPTTNTAPTYITINTPAGPITYLSTMDPAILAQFEAKAQALATEAAKKGLVNFASIPAPTQPPTDVESMAITNSLKAMSDMCTEQPKLAFQADRGAGVSQVVFRASYSAACIVDPNMTWSFSDGNLNDAQSGTLGNGWSFGRLNSSIVNNLAIYSFNGVYPGITTFTFTVGSTTATATLHI